MSTDFPIAFPFPECCSYKIPFCHLQRVLFLSPTSFLCLNLSYPHPTCGLATLLPQQHAVSTPVFPFHPILQFLQLLLQLLECSVNVPLSTFHREWTSRSWSQKIRGHIDFVQEQRLCCLLPGSCTIHTQYPELIHGASFIQWSLFTTISSVWLRVQKSSLRESNSSSSSQSLEKVDETAHFLRQEKQKSMNILPFSHS